MRTRPGTSPARSGAGARVVLVASVLSLVACGVPTDPAAQVIDATAVPSALLQPAESVAPGATGAGDAETRPAASGPAVAFTLNDRLVLVRQPREPGQPLAIEQALLDVLVAGPTDAERTQGLGTALPESLLLTAAALDAGVLTVDVTGSTEGAPEAEAPTAIAQIVLTATSLPLVRAVVLVRDGQAIPVPRADGVSTTSPLTADEFASWLDAAAGR